MEKDFILDKNKNSIAEIEYNFHRKSIIEDKSYIHYKGRIVSPYKLEHSLKALLNQKEELINQGVFFVEDIDKEINKFNLSLQKSKKIIFNLYLENNDIDFYIEED